MKNTSLILLVSVLLSNLIIIIIAYNIFKNKLKKQEKSIKKHFNSILGLSISHLHDAANFFSLIRQNINEEYSNNAANYAKGAAYHFRTIFDELKNSFDSFNLRDISELSKAKFDLLYQKDAVDLKDLLEMELFQISHFDRVRIIDNSNTEHAIVYGNFSLLSKAILNLVENALKYTENTVKLELNDSGKNWLLKISSFGKAIPEEIANNLNSANKIRTGHGLSSLLDILDFHNSKAEITTLAAEGSIISFELEKYSDSLKLSQEARTTKKTFKFSPIIFIILSILMMVISSCIIILHNRKSCLAYFKDKTKITTKHTVANDLEYKLEFIKSSLLAIDQILQEINNENYPEKIQELKEKRETILKNTISSEKNFMSLILFKYLHSANQPLIENYLEKEALKLIVYYPDSLLLNHYKSQNYSKRKIYHKVLFYSYKELTSLFHEKLFLNPELYAANKLNSSDFESYSLVLASILKNPEKTSFKQQELLMGEDPIEEIKKAAEKKIADLEADNELLTEIENNEEINKYRAPADFNERIDPIKPVTDQDKSLDKLINEIDSSLEIKYEL